jgi:hypothetical protein
MEFENPEQVHGLLAIHAAVEDGVITKTDNPDGTAFLDMVDGSPYDPDEILRRYPRDELIKRYGDASQ